jgi:hypothetical protein
MRHKSLCSANEQARMRPVNHPAPPQPFADMHFGRRPVSYTGRPQQFAEIMEIEQLKPGMRLLLSG